MSQKAVFLVTYDELCSKMQNKYIQISKSTENKKVIIKEINELCSYYEREYDDLQIQFARVEGIRWDKVREGFNIDKDRFTNLKWKLEGKLCPCCQTLLIEKGFQYCYDCQKKVWATNEKKRQKQWKKQKLSHCNYCGKQTKGSRYIYDLTTKILEPSVNNASDPDNQWLFCSETHFEKWHKKNYYCCGECLEESYTGKYKYNKRKKDGQRFCSDHCFFTHYAEKCDDCLEKCVSVYQNKVTGFAQIYYSDPQNKTGILCSKCHTEKLKEESEERRKDKELEESCKRISENTDDLVEVMKNGLRESGKDKDNLEDDNSEEEENSNLDDKSNQIKSNQIKSNQIKSNLNHFTSNSISSVELTNQGDLVITYSDAKNTSILKPTEITDSSLQKIKKEMEKNGTKKLSKEDLERQLRELESQKNQNQEPKGSGLGLKIGLGVLVGVGLMSLVVMIAKRGKNKIKKY